MQQIMEKSVPGSGSQFYFVFRENELIGYLPVFPGDTAQTRKLSAAWLIDACGWKGAREGDAGVSDAHALVLVNHGHASGAQLLTLARRIATSVQEKFGVALEPEPRIIGDRWTMP